MQQKILIDKNEIDCLRSKDDHIRKLIDTIGEIDRECIPDPFIALVNSIVFQQLAYKAAICIWNRFEAFIVEINPDNILQANFESLRTCGLSSTKINYIKNIAETVKRNEVDFTQFSNMSDAEIIENLVKIKGIGKWTAEMFLIFSLNRKNILSYNDLAIVNGLKWLYHMKKEPTTKQLDSFHHRFSPYNTLASFYLWEITIRNYFKYEDVDKINLKNYVTYFESPIGIIEIQSDEGEIIVLDFIKSRRYPENLEPVLLQAKKELKEYFEGKRKNFNLPIKMNGTDYQKKVWEALINIPYGITSSYKDIAENTGNSRASRAVGNANNKNKMSIIIPCHRVVGSNGRLVGYAGGVWRKEWLLNHEKKFI